jgi:hypothetical protein
VKELGHKIRSKAGDELRVGALTGTSKYRSQSQYKEVATSAHIHWNKFDAWVTVHISGMEGNTDLFS